MIHVPKGITMHNLLPVLALLCLPSDPSLKPGDPAPALIASKWLQGEAVGRFEPGKVYVVEFWATWCGWCIAFMPHLAELQAHYGAQGVTVIGFSARDPDNSEEQVTALIAKRGPKLRYAFAYADDRQTYEAWVTAAGRKGLPCTFVVDKTGRIAYIGHPMYLGVVLPRVVAGDRPARTVSAEVARIEEEAGVVSETLRHDPGAGLKALQDYEAKYPPLANLIPWLRAKFTYFPKLGRVDEARQLAEAVIAKALAQDDPVALGVVCGVLRQGPGKASKELMAVAVKAAEAEVRLTGDKDAAALLNLASTYSQVGDQRAREYARKAVAAAADAPPAQREHIERQAKLLDKK
jgi:thiol-disulfide isomerase/thioredoxin